MNYPRLVIVVLVANVFVIILGILAFIREVRSSVEQIHHKMDILEQEFKETQQRWILHSDQYKNDIAALKTQLQAAEEQRRKLFNKVQIASMTDSGGWQTFRATFYSNSVKSTGKKPGDKGYGITYSGNPTEVGLTVSVDPDVIPLGSWIVVRFPDGTMETYRADDIGSGIRGNHIDIFVATDEIARKKGVMEVQVKILE